MTGVGGGGGGGAAIIGAAAGMYPPDEPQHEELQEGAQLGAHDAPQKYRFLPADSSFLSPGALLLSTIENEAYLRTIEILAKFRKVSKIQVK